MIKATLSYMLTQKESDYLADLLEMHKKAHQKKIETTKIEFEKNKRKEIVFTIEQIQKKLHLEE